MKGNLVIRGFVLFGRGQLGARLVLKNETFLPLGTSVIKWIMGWVSYSSGQMDKPTTERWLNRNFVFHGLLCLFGIRGVQRYSRSVIFRKTFSFRWTGGSFLKQDNSFRKISLRQSSLKHDDAGPSYPLFSLHFLTISEMSISAR